MEQIAIPQQKSNNKIQWLSILQGLCMLMVVIDHIRLSRDNIMPWSDVLNDMIESFIMPLFMFISGWLFYYTCIRKEKSYKEVVKSKFIRLGIPFFAFTIIATLVKFPLPFLMRRPVDADEIINTFVFFRSNPLFELWFTNTLFEMMLLYPVLKAATKNRWLSVFALIVALAIYYLIQKDITFFRLNYIRWLLIYFVLGTMASKYQILEKINGWWPIVVGVCLFAILFPIGLSPHRTDFPLSIVGIFLCVAVSRKLVEFYPSLFSSFRDYTYQIFLMAIFFQMPIRWLFNALHQNWLYIPLYFVSLLVGIYLPTIIAKYIKRKAPRFIKMCLGLSK